METLVEKRQVEKVVQVDREVHETHAAAQLLVDLIASENKRISLPENVTFCKFASVCKGKDVDCFCPSKTCHCKSYKWHRWNPINLFRDL